MTESASAVPELLPARMLNEFVYCPRLFYLEWVDKQWQSNDDTEAGRWVHRDVDSRHGALAPPGEASPDTVRSVELSDEGWGLTAVVDRVDHSDGSVSPVDYKRGRPGPHGLPWPADRIQTLVQCALLESTGYEVAEGIVSYAETHQRVSVAWDEAARDDLAREIQRAREVAAAPLPPPPLVDSPKCTRCSLAGLCLPDEINVLLARKQVDGRRILPRNPDSSPLYVTEPGAVVSVKGGRVVVSKKREILADVRLIDVQSLSVHGNVQISTQALTRLWGVGAPVLYLSSGGWLNGWSSGQPTKNVELRRRQVFAHAMGVRFACRMINGKIRNQRTLLRRLSREPLPPGALETLSSLASRALSARSLPELLGVEGGAASIYFDALPGLIAPTSALRELFAAEGRKKRPPPDPVNAVLSYCYALLTRDFVVACLGVGFDPYLGVLHRPRFGRPSLALDLMEEFRPIIADSVTITLFNTGELTEKDFIQRGIGVQLTTEGRKKVIRAYERRVTSEMRHPVYKYRISYRRAFEVQARVLAAAMIGEIDDFVPVVTR